MVLEVRDAARRKEPFEDQAVHDCEDREPEEGEANEQEVACEASERDEQHAPQDERRGERFQRFEAAAQVTRFQGETQRVDGRSRPFGWSCTGEAEPNVGVVDVAPSELEPVAEDGAEPPAPRDIEEDEALISGGRR